MRSTSNPQPRITFTKQLFIFYAEEAKFVVYQSIRYYMIRISLSLLLLLISLPGFSQKYINEKKADIKKDLQQYVSDNKTLKATLSETDSSLVLTVPGEASQQADFIYFFDKEGKCRLQKTIAYCNTCIDKYLQDALKQDKYKWRKINENQYISSFEEKLMIELPADGKEFSFMVIRTDWSKIIYDMLSEIKQ